jgi:hypothetical protein
LSPYPPSSSRTSIMRQCCRARAHRSRLPKSGSDRSLTR